MFNQTDADLSIEHIDLTNRYGFNHGRDGFVQVQKRLKLEIQLYCIGSIGAAM